VTFRCLGAEELDEEGAYDFVYSRYLLWHLRHPERALEAMVRALRLGGRLVLEDVYFSDHVCYPANAAFDRYLELYQAAVRFNGADPTIGARLLGMALDSRLVDVQVELVMPVFRCGEASGLRRCRWSTSGRRCWALGWPPVPKSTPSLPTWRRSQTTYEQ